MYFSYDKYIYIFKRQNILTFSFDKTMLYMPVLSIVQCTLRLNRNTLLYSTVQFLSAGYYGRLTQRCVLPACSQLILIQQRFTWGDTNVTPVMVIYTYNSFSEYRKQGVGDGRIRSNKKQIFRKYGK